MLLEEYAAMAVELRSAARALEARLQATQANAVYRREVVLPLRAAVVAEAQLNYNAMTVTPFELITAKRQQIDAAVEYVHAVRDYWIARADLEQLLDGGRPPMVNMIGVMK
jgi:cobalt-zinc-cadmium efflux system outer membrane protein